MRPLKKPEPMRQVQTVAVVYTAPGHHPWKPGSAIPVPESHFADLVRSGAVRDPSAPKPAAVEPGRPAEK